MCDDSQKLSHAPKAERLLHGLFPVVVARRRMRVQLCATMKTSCVYRYIHIATGRSYIGSTVDIKARRIDHRTKAAASKSQTHFHRALRKYGENAFEFEILEICPPHLLRLREEFYIQQSKNLFNIQRHPQQAFVRKMSEECRKMQSERMRGNKYGKKLIGRRHSLESRHKISLAKIGKPRRGGPLSEQHKRNISLARTGFKISEQTRSKLILAQRNRVKTGPHPIQWRRNISTALNGHIISTETRQKISAKAKNWWSNNSRERNSDGTFKPRPLSA